ncbi:hypothetical protein [Nocardia jiangsuensis]|uniref:Uncharacterized protein n=1 Tax=Nocardia jiangsuensis TaxID=1691563 RepID=A0ABV8DRZ5_9NOCA
MSAAGRWRYPTALTAVGDDPGLSDGIAWVARRSRRFGGTPLVYAPGRSNVDDNPWLREFVDEARALVATWRRPATTWRGGPVLAAWPTPEELTRIADDRRTTALCVVPNSLDEVAAWAQAAQPRLLGPAVPPPGAARLDPVVAEALTTLSGLVDPASNLTAAQDRRDAAAVLSIAHENGHSFTGDDVYAWTLANGWPARAATRLAALAAHVSTGQRPPLPTSTFATEILDVWRDRATQGDAPK